MIDLKKIFNENKTLFILAIIIIISLIFMGVGLIRYFYGSNKDPYEIGLEIKISIQLVKILEEILRLYMKVE